MKKAILILFIATAFTACDKKEETAPAEETAEATKPAEEAAASEKAEEPEEQAESAGHDGHDHGEKQQAKMPDDMKPGETGFYGAKFTVIEPAMTLAKALEVAPEAKGPVKVEATIQKVCKKKGCWFTMADDSTDEEIRVKMKDYGFFVPKNADGAKVIAEGTLTSREIPQEEAQHYADDAAEAGEAPKKVEGPQKVWEFTAQAVEVRAAEG